MQILEGISSNIFALEQAFPNQFRQQFIDLYRSVLAVDSIDYLANERLGIIHYEAKEGELAESCFRNSIKINQYSKLSNFYLGNIYLGKSDYSSAIECFENALNDEIFPEGLLNLANAYGKCGMALQEFETLSRLVEYFPDYENGLLNLGVNLYASGKIKDSIDMYERCLQINPDIGVAKVNLAIAYLMNKEYVKGFTLYESRWGNIPNCIPRELPFEMWNPDSASNSILITVEQGFGDCLQMLRYIPMLQNHFRNIYVEVQKPLFKLVQMVFKDVNVVPYGDTLPKVDCYAPIMSLPHLFHTSYESVPSPNAYISIPIDNSVTPFDDTYKIGVCWKGGDINPAMTHRSLAISDFKSIFEYPFKFKSLVKELSANEIEVLSQFENVESLSSSMNDFYDTATIINTVDCVVTVDTAIAHLSGAMGKKTYLLLNPSSDWRWHIGDTSSPWYESIQIVRTAEYASLDFAMRYIINNFIKNE